ncbi:hypothetical protein Cgig2_029155 [Carnegiea gigantea]|uniref:TLDc domain-containing protein n=1 Tax=Carnegiea gigantea TaxID=171969 RepID=A0A9Q1QKI5_9CARY|nr:hypothetical protein Cgig2_029155 [Carnegiea gigantea]
MYAFKDKVSEKLSRLLLDAPSQPLQSTQANSHSKEANTFSSLLSYIHPLSTRNKTGDYLKPLQSSPVRWSSKGRVSRRSEYKKAECISREQYQESASSHAEQDNPLSVNKACAPEVFEDAVEAQGPVKLMPNLTADSSFIYVELYEFLHASLPNIVKGCQWVLLYSTLKHGISLRTLIRKSADLSGPGLLVVGDRKGAVFGGLLDCPIKPCPKRKYQGANQTFVFTTRYGEPRLFRSTGPGCESDVDNGKSSKSSVIAEYADHMCLCFVGANRYFYLCLNDFLAFGGGGNFALAMDGDLLTGSSGPCETFGNSCLAHDPEFELKNVELWGFAHLSRYL